jgi:hypothetical protein
VTGVIPDMSYIRNQIPIVEVARALGIRTAGRNTAHCWRVGSHQNGDRTPSLSFFRNRAKCHGCDMDSMSVIDLVINHEEFEPSSALREATEWICARWTVPTIAKNTKLSRPERWSTSPVGLSSFPLEELVRSGMWAALDDAARAILPALFCFAENGQVTISYRGLCRYSGKASYSTVAKVLRQFKEIGLLEALPKARKNFRDAGRYRFTLDSEKFQAVRSSVHERLKMKRDKERALRSQLKAASTHSTTPQSNPKDNPTHPGPYPGTTTLYTTVECEQSARSTVVECEGKNTRNGKGPVSEKRCVERRAVCGTPRYTRVQCEEAKRRRTGTDEALKVAEA